MYRKAGETNETAALQPSRDRVLESAIFYPFSSTRIIVFKFDQEFSIETFDQSRKNLIIKGKYTLKPMKILDISFIFEYLLYLFFHFISHLCFYFILCIKLLGILGDFVK